MKSDAVFRLVVAALVLTGAAVLFLALTAGHRLPRDTETVPTVPVGEPAPARR